MIMGVGACAAENGEVSPLTSPASPGSIPSCKQPVGCRLPAAGSPQVAAMLAHHSRAAPVFGRPFFLGSLRALGGSVAGTIRSLFWVCSRPTAMDAVARLAVQQLQNTIEAELPRQCRQAVGQRRVALAHRPQGRLEVLSDQRECCAALRAALAAGRRGRRRSARVDLLVTAKGPGSKTVPRNL